MSVVFTRLWLYACSCRMRSSHCGYMHKPLKDLGIGAYSNINIATVSAPQLLGLCYSTLGPFLSIYCTFSSSLSSTSPTPSSPSSPSFYSPPYSLPPPPPPLTHLLPLIPLVLLPPLITLLLLPPLPILCRLHLTHRSERLS